MDTIVVMAIVLCSLAGSYLFAMLLRAYYNERDETPVPLVSVDLARYAIAIDEPSNEGPLCRVDLGIVEEMR
jgi:hypothetical protein